MAVFGKIDSRPLAVGTGVDVVDVGDGAVRVNLVGIGDPLSVEYVAPGDIIELGNPGVAYVIARTIDDDSAELSKPYALGVGTGIDATRRTVPKEVAAYYHKSEPTANNATGAADSVVKEILGVSLAEAQTDGARSRGITGPGWWLYQTYTSGSSGNTRHKAECIASFKVSRYGYQLGDTPIAAASAHVDGDDALLTDGTTAEDTVTPNTTAIINIDVQPVDVGDGATTVEVPAADQTFTVTATTDPAGGTLTYQWQRRAVGSGRFVNITGTTDSSAYLNFNTATLTVQAAALADTSLDGYEYRVKVNADQAGTAVGAPEVISDVVKLNLVDLV